jgi:class 3 adenylate cyclase/tetratricopeptide (TPR) repeat protein
MAVCVSCSAEAPANARFCPSCGAALVRSPETRKLVTVLFCDWVGSTTLGEALDAESLRRVQEAFYTEARRVLERHGGTVEKFIGDAVMAVFGIPVAHEDDALRGARAAVELRAALSALNERLERDHGVLLTVRTGLNTGEAVAGDPAAGQGFVTGDVVVVGKRLEEAASSGDILIGETTRLLVRDAAVVEPLDAVTVKGKAAPLRAWRLLGLITGAPGVARRLDAELVGREHELTLLQQAFERATTEGSGHLFTVLGPAGVGKSRLVREVVRGVGDDAAVLIGRCLAYGDGITFWPLLDVVRQAAEIGRELDAASARERIATLVADDPDAGLVTERVASAVGLFDRQASTEETFWAVRRLFAAIARRRPLLLGFDDVHWAEPTFLDLIEYLADWIRDLPVLLVCLSRPELLDLRPTWAGGKPNASTITLEPLGEAECAELVSRLLGAGDLPSTARRELAAASEGNPLFVEELVAMLIDDGVLRRENGSWIVGDLSRLRVPPTIQALVGARLDRLEPGERTVLEAASVAGRFFSRASVSELAGEEELDAALASLVRKELIRGDTGGPGEDAFRFRHTLIRDAAYASAPKERRADLHERFASRLERTRGDRLAEVEEIVGYHLAQAHGLRSELGRNDEDLARKAGQHLSAAGRRARARGDTGAAVVLLRRALGTLPPADSRRPELLGELGSALITAGEFAEADAVLADVVEADRGDPRLRLRALVDREFVRSFTHPEAGSDRLVAVARSVIPELEELNDDVGLAKAWWLLSEADSIACRWRARADALERALVHARSAGAAEQSATIVALLAQALYYGPMPVGEALARCESLLADSAGGRPLEAALTSTLAGLHAMQGDFHEARGLWQQATAIYDDLGLRFRRAARSLLGAEVELLAGDVDAAVRELQRGYDTLEQMGERAARSTIAAVLARTLAAQGRYADADRLARFSEETAGADDLITQIVWRAARAEVLASQSRTEEAEPLARAAVELAATTDFPDLQAHADLSLAVVLRAADRAEQAAAAVSSAVATFERKGNTVAAARAATLLAPAGR